MLTNPLLFISEIGTLIRRRKYYFSHFLKFYRSEFTRNKPVKNEGIFHWFRTDTPTLTGPSQAVVCTSLQQVCKIQVVRFSEHDDIVKSKIASRSNYNPHVLMFWCLAILFTSTETENIFDNGNNF
uniref:Uncharacterized protein n=1 Tax=Oryza punctata TaxID=4537 RepID=A0A0E0L5F0_ORYPU